MTTFLALVLIVPGLLLVAGNRKFAEVSTRFGVASDVEPSRSKRQLLYSRAVTILVGVAMIAIGVSALLR